MSNVTTVRRPSLSVTLNGTPITGVLSARCRLGFDQPVATAEVEVRALPVGIDCWDEVAITMGGTAGTAAVRFTGFFVSHEASLYENVYRLICRGKLAKAEQYQKAVETDMSSRGLGYTDQSMVSRVIYDVGIAPEPDPFVVLTGIGGTGETLGTVSWERGFAWREGETALSFIQELDSVCLGYRTFDTANGDVVREQITTAPAVSPDWTFTQGVDIFRANAADEVLTARNRVVVEGFPGWDGKSKISHTEDGANPFLLLPGDEQFYLAHKVSSSMIEKQLTADSGDGLSCEEVATWLLAEMNRRTVRCVLTTPRDDVVSPGDTVAVVSARLGLNQSFWVQAVETSINRQNAFSQSLTCIGSHPLPE